MMSKQRYRHLIFVMSALLLPSSTTTLSSRGKVRRTQVVEENGISLEEIEHNFEPDGDFSVSDAAAALLQFDHGERAPRTEGRGISTAPTPVPAGVYRDSSGFEQNQHGELRSSHVRSGVSAEGPSILPIPSPVIVANSALFPNHFPIDHSTGSPLVLVPSVESIDSISVDHTPFDVTDDHYDGSSVSYGRLDDSGKGKGGKKGSSKSKDADKGKGKGGKKGKKHSDDRQGKGGAERSPSPSSSSGKGKGGVETSESPSVSLGKGKGPFTSSPSSRGNGNGTADCSPSPSASSSNSTLNPSPNPSGLIPTISSQPSMLQSANPSEMPSLHPSGLVPTISPHPSTQVSMNPSSIPSPNPSGLIPTISPRPSMEQSMMPSGGLSFDPTIVGEPTDQTGVPSPCSGRDCGRPTRPVRKLTKKQKG